MPDHPSERDETDAERLDRNLIELLQEVRVVQTGVQVLFAFLLTVPFSTSPPIRNVRLTGASFATTCVGLKKKTRLFLKALATR